MDINELCDSIQNILNEKKAQDIERIPVAEKTTLAEFFIIASGNSVVQVKTMEAEVEEKIKQRFQICPEHVEGREGGRWVLMDYGAVVVHLFHKEERAYYKLDQLWQSAMTINAREQMEEAQH